MIGKGQGGEGKGRQWRAVGSKGRAEFKEHQMPDTITQEGQLKLDDEQTESWCMHWKSPGVVQENDQKCILEEYPKESRQRVKKGLEAVWAMDETK